MSDPEADILPEEFQAVSSTNIANGLLQLLHTAGSGPS
jgi:hypothetical protein